MGGFNKLEPVIAAQKFLDKSFLSCDGALLAGSVVRGEATETSDLDIVVFDNGTGSSYRESVIDFGWHINGVNEKEWKLSRLTIQLKKKAAVILRKKMFYSYLLKSHYVK